MVRFSSVARTTSKTTSLKSRLNNTKANAFRNSDFIKLNKIHFRFIFRPILDSNNCDWYARWNNTLRRSFVTRLARRKEDNKAFFIEQKQKKHDELIAHFQQLSDGVFKVWLNVGFLDPWKRQPVDKIDYPISESSRYLDVWNRAPVAEYLKTQAVAHLQDERHTTLRESLKELESLEAEHNNTVASIAGNIRKDLESLFGDFPILKEEYEAQKSKHQDYYILRCACATIEKTMRPVKLDSAINGLDIDGQTRDFVLTTNADVLTQVFNGLLSIREKYEPKLKPLLPLELRIQQLCEIIRKESGNVIEEIGYKHVLSGRCALEEELDRQYSEAN